MLAKPPDFRDSSKRESLSLPKLQKSTKRIGK